METATLPASAAASAAAPFSPNPSPLLSSSEQYFLSNGISHDIRCDGRSRLDYRYFQLRTAVMAHCAGSARMKLEGTDVLVTVTADITPTEWSRPDEGMVQCSVDTAASFASSGGNSSALLAPSELKAALELLYIRSRCLDLRQLCILRGEQCWTLYVDVLVLEADGSLLDAASLAAKAALLSTKLPAVAVSGGANSLSSQQAVEVTLTDGPPTRLHSTERLPVCVTLHAFNRSSHFAIDARADEEAAAEWRLSVGVDDAGRVVSADKGGRLAAPQPLMAAMMATARKVGADLNRIVRKCSASDSDSSGGQTDMQIQ